MRMAERWLARKTPARSWAEQDDRDRVGACESDSWGPCPDLHDPFPLLGALPLRVSKRTPTLIGMPRPPKGL